MGKWPWRLLLALWATLAATGAAHAEKNERGLHVIVGRADADASGGWPVAVWVLDGERSQFIVRAPREQLATLPGQPWEAMDAAALLGLERYGAPRLVRQWDDDPCPSTLLWLAMEADPISIIHVAAERDALEHGSCGAAACGDRAWRIRLPPEPVLPLKWLMPGLATRQPEWLVLYVVSPDEALRVAGVPLLDLPPPLRFGSPWRSYDLPWAASAQFPAIHAAALEHAAAGQGLAQASVLMRSEAQTTVQPLRFSRLWHGSEAHRQALGFKEPSVQGHYIVRLLLRLHPAQLPAELKLEPVSQRSQPLFKTLRAGQPLARSLDSCRRSMDELDCEAACTQRIEALRRSHVSRFGPRGAEANTPTEVMMPTCRAACEQQKDQVSMALERSLAAVPQRQQQAWRWVEDMTGRPAASWQAR